MSDNLSRASRSNGWLYVDPVYPEDYSFDLEALDRLSDTGSWEVE